MNRYSAQKQYWKAKQTKQDKEKIADVVLLQKLQVSRPEGPSSSEWTVPEGRLSDDIQTSRRANPGMFCFPENSLHGGQDLPWVLLSSGCPSAQLCCLLSHHPPLLMDH